MHLLIVDTNVHNNNKKGALVSENYQFLFMSHFLTLPSVIAHSIAMIHNFIMLFYIYIYIYIYI